MQRSRAALLSVPGVLTRLPMLGEKRKPEVQKTAGSLAAWISLGLDVILVLGRALRIMNSR